MTFGSGNDFKRRYLCQYWPKFMWSYYSYLIIEANYQSFMVAEAIAMLPVQGWYKVYAQPVRDVVAK